MDKGKNKNTTKKISYLFLSIFSKKFLIKNKAFSSLFIIKIVHFAYYGSFFKA